jgi:hypothetical protein
MMNRMHENDNLQLNGPPVEPVTRRRHWQCFGLCRPPLDKLPDTRLLGTWYAEVGGPLALWRAWATNVSGGPFDAGHFFPEEIPEQTDPSIAIIAVQRRL